MKLVEIFFTNGQSTEIQDAYFVYLPGDSLEIRDYNSKNLIAVFNFYNIAGAKNYEV